MWIIRPFLWIICLFSCLFAAAQNGQYRATTVAFYNLENLFDIYDSEETNDKDFLPQGSYAWNMEKYENKLANMSKVISQIGSDVVSEGPAVIGVCEVENRKVLEDLVATPLLASKEYSIIHFDSPDERGIDNALLYQKRFFIPTNSKAYNVVLEEKENGDIDYTRDVLLVSGRLNGEKVHFLVNHWPSRSGGEARSQPRRIAAARVNMRIMDSIKQHEPNAKIMVMGDFNDHPNNESIKGVLNTSKKMKKTKEGQLFNPFYKYYKKGLGTTAWRDSWGLFDMIIVSSALINGDPGKLKYYRAGVFRQPWLTQKTGKYKGYPLRTHAGGAYMNGYSDHFAVYVILVRELNRISN